MLSGDHVIALGLSLFLALLVPTNVVTQTRSLESLDHFVDGPRPLVDAIALHERWCQCSITYEDPKWDERHTLDRTPVRQRSNPAAKRLRIPDGRAFSFRLDLAAGPTSRSNTEESLRNLLNIYNASGDVTHYQLTQDPRAFHFKPANGSAMDARLSIDQTNATLADFIEALFKAVKDVNGRDIVIAAGPVKLLSTARVSLVARNESAESVLGRLLASVDVQRKLSWRLTYDIGFDKYYLSVFFVPAR